MNAERLKAVQRALAGIRRNHYPRPDCPDCYCWIGPRWYAEWRAAYLMLALHVRSRSR